ncbi:hypothetical protein M407DRAFT_246299 [Tulasnella calospora MUT 4182]|uniref:Uncharacterized protein n=1 Tax=Tulasnella calospora MUT 4182 TaxID=1051891 RepID=A0A0C3PVS3_9AGAM|nr:hypothetical protein M407DRAFT_246299 [Tulasnella calospora MUT 4182]
MAILCGTSSKSSETTLKGYRGTILRQPWQTSASPPDIRGPGVLVLSARSDTAELYGESGGRGSASWFYPKRPARNTVSFFLEPI